jgi:hypothetical protein
MIIEITIIIEIIEQTPVDMPAIVIGTIDFVHKFVGYNCTRHPDTIKIITAYIKH